MATRLRIQETINDQQATLLIIARSSRDCLSISLLSKRRWQLDHVAAGSHRRRDRRDPRWGGLRRGGCGKNATEGGPHHHRRALHTEAQLAKPEALHQAPGVEGSGGWRADAADQSGANKHCAAQEAGPSRPPTSASAPRARR